MMNDSTLGARTITQLNEIKSPQDLAQYLEINFETLRFFSYGEGRNSLYEKFEIQKKSGGTREIYSPIDKLKRLQRTIADDLKNYYRPLPNVFGFVNNRSVKENAAQHIGQKFVLNIDLANFFPSIHFGRVRGLFEKAPFEIPRQTAKWLAQLVTFESVLPQGAPSSPIISNMICLKMDKLLSRFAEDHDLKYTRYADDLTFSTSRETFPHEVATLATGSVIIGEELKQIVEKNGFNINGSKTRLQHKSQRQEVTGVVVNEKCNLTRKYLNTIRGELHRLVDTHNDDDDELRDKVTGRLGYLKHILGEFDSRYLRAKAKLNGLNLTASVGWNETFYRSVAWIFETDEGHATAFYIQGIGWITVAHALPSTNQNAEEAVHFCKIFHPDNPNKKYHITYQEHDKNKDYLIFKSKAKPIVKTVLATNIPSFGQEYRFTGYSTDLKGNSITIINSEIAGTRNILGFQRYLVNSIIYHGMSGGPVFDQNHSVIGIITHGTAEAENVIRPSSFTSVRDLFNGV